jgi:Asp/Glu/hydantoin racemase
MYTAPEESPASINDADDINASTEIVWANLEATGLLNDYDGVLIACYSKHTLVEQIQARHPCLPVTGIFEASVLASLPLVKAGHGWGIVTTGKFWEAHLADAITSFLGGAAGSFLGVHSTGLAAGDFHGDVPPEVIRDKLKAATRRLLTEGLPDCILMGCGGMAGLEEVVREAVRELLGEQVAKAVYVVDGVRAGVGVVEQMVRSKRMFQISS